MTPNEVRANYIRNVLTESEAKTALIAIDRLVADGGGIITIRQGDVSDAIIGSLELEGVRA